MTAITDILGQLPIDQLASQLGASTKDTKSAATSAITSLLGGMTHNAQTSAGEAALAKALTGHAGKTTSVANADTEDGTKIVQHVLGTTPAKAAAAVSAKTGNDSSLITKLLPMLAPMVMSYMGSKATQSTGSSGGGNILSSVLGGVLGGGTSTASSSSGGLSGMLGGMLGEALGSKTATASTKTPAPAQEADGGILGKVLNSIF